MSYLGSWAIDDYLTIMATTHNPTTGAAAAADPITVRIYEDDTDTEIVSDQAMTAFDSVTGLYKYKQQLTAAAGFEAGKCYTALISATVATVAAIVTHTFQIQAKTTAVTVSDKTGYGLADDAITAAKFDESTAFPLAAVDTGATAVARTGADSDTLETLSDQIDSVPTTGEIRTELSTELGRIDAAITTRSSHDAAAVKTAIEAAGSSIASILEDTAELQTNQGNWLTATGFATPTNITAGTITTVSGNVNGSVGSVTGAVGSVTGAVGSVTAGVTLANNSVSAAALNTDAVTEIVNAIKASTGWTAGGTFTLAEVIKILAAWSAGNWQDGTSGYDVLDAEDGETTVLNVTPSATTPQKTVVIS